MYIENDTPYWDDPELLAIAATSRKHLRDADIDTQAAKFVDSLSIDDYLYLDVQYSEYASVLVYDGVRGDPRYESDNEQRGDSENFNYTLEMLLNTACNALGLTAIWENGDLFIIDTDSPNYDPIRWE